MPKEEQGFDWEKIKTDPRLWMRLTTPTAETGALGRVFKDSGNPFQTDPEGSIETLKELASQGKLYLREYGRASHFKKVELDGDKPKLEGTYVQKLNGNTDPVSGLLMRLSRAYFKWLGLESISNWFDNRLKRRDERIQRDKEVKAEYKDMSKLEKAQLKKQLRQEKLEASAQKKLENLQKELDKTQQELNKLRGIDSSKTKGEMNSPLTTPPTTEPKKNTLQPTHLGDKPVQNQQTVEGPQKTNLSQERTISQQIPGENKTTNKEEKKAENKAAPHTPDFQLNVNDVEYTNQDVKALPEEVKRALELITAFINQQKQIENALQQEKTITNAPKTNEKEVKQEAPALSIDTAVQEEVLGKKEVPPFKIENTAQHEVLRANKPGVPDLIVESIGHVEVPQQENGKTAVEGEVAKGDMPSPLEQPAELEPEKVTIQKQETPALREQPAADAMEMDQVKDWKGLLANSLFSHEEAKNYKGNYDMVKDLGNLGAEYLIGAVAGMLTSEATPEAKQQVMDTLLAGKPLGSEHQDMLKAGIASMDHAEMQSTNGNKQEMAEMLADTIRELSRQASRESGLSAQNVMIGRMITAAATMAGDNGLALPLSEDDMTLARGAATMADMALRYNDARQYLSKEPMDTTSRKGRNAVRDLLAGTAIETMISDNHKDGQEITNTQLLMGQGLWDMENLLVMTRDSKTCQKIKPEQVKALLDEPHGFKAARVANHIVTDLLEEAMEVQKSVDEMMEKQMQNEQELEQPEAKAMQVPG